MVQDIQAFGTKGMATMNQYTRNFFTYIKIFSAKVAIVKASGFVVCLQNIFWFKSIFSILFNFSSFFSFIF